MKKYNLPVILLKGLVLLPHNTMKLEFDGNNTSNSVIEMSELFHDSYVLVVSEYSKGHIPNIGVLAKIENKMELPNGNIRMDIRGIKRIMVLEYMNLTKTNEPLEAIVSEIQKDAMNHEKEELLIKKIIKEAKAYVKNIPYSSNSVIQQLEQINNLDELVDVLVPSFITSLERIQEYLDTVDVNIRSEMILKDIYKEKEMFRLERNLDMKVKKELDDTQKEFFLREKIKFMKEELGDSSKDDEIESLRVRIEESGCSDKIKEKLRLELKRYESTPNISPEVNVIRDYLEWMLSLSWDTYTEDNKDLRKVRESLDKSHYGLEKVKDRIIEYLAVTQITNQLRGPIICLVGPPGVGKTSLAYSIADSLNRNFVKIAVGGIRDESEIVGHRRTYVGANPGRIISSMKKAKSCNPVFLIDEVDKMNSDYKGDPTSSLLSVLDPEQNKNFSDNYIEEEYDLSKVMFVLTANYLENIPEPLLDRLEVIDLSGYTEYEKLDIAKKYLLSKICKENGLPLQFLEIDDNTLLYIIRHYTKEAGVRELERQLSKIVRKIVTQIVMHHIQMNKVIVGEKVIEKYLGPKKFHDFKMLEKSEIGVVNGLAYTPYGGDVLPIEVNYYKGDGKLVLTGSLGDVMKESATIAFSYIKANHQRFNISYDKLTGNDIHIHVPEGAIKKDGPSAGVALTLALVSSFTKTKIPKNIGLTGEITLRGKVLAIGGLKEKSIGALRGGVKKIFIPQDNLKDLEEIPKEVKENITFIPIKDFTDIWRTINVRD